MNITELLAIGFQATFIGMAFVQVCYWIVKGLIKALEAKVIDEAEKAGLAAKPELAAIPIKIEKVQDIIYFFRADTDAFVCQGRNMEELSLAFHAKFGDRWFSVHEEDAAFLKSLPE